MMTHIYLDIPVEKARANEGCGGPTNRSGAVVMAYWRSVRVEADGTVRAYDTVSESYTIHHDLTDAEVTEARRLAALVRVGTHYVASGAVFERAVT